MPSSTIRIVRNAAATFFEPLQWFGEGLTSILRPPFRRLRDIEGPIFTADIEAVAMIPWLPRYILQTIARLRHRKPTSKVRLIAAIYLRTRPSEWSRIVENMEWEKMGKFYDESGNKVSVPEGIEFFFILESAGEYDHIIILGLRDEVDLRTLVAELLKTEDIEALKDRGRLKIESFKAESE
jgi:hypothetical protein